MNNDTVDRISQSDVVVLANTIQQSNNDALILETLERLRAVNLDDDTLKATHIAAIVHALTKRDDLSASIHELASELVNDWKTVASAAVQQTQTQALQSLYDVHVRTPPPYMDTVEIGEQESLKNKVGIEIAAPANHTDL